MTKKSRDDGMVEQVQEQHALINNTVRDEDNPDFKRTTHPDAQWFPDAGFGMFIHWGINTVWGMGDISWPMIKSKPGVLSKRHRQVGLGAHWVNISPNRYWDLAKNFNPKHFDPDKILKAAKEAGCRYAVLTTKHHDGFAMWPSQFGDFNTNTYMKGRDLVGEYVKACRRQDLKVGLYFSPPDWHYNRDHMSFCKHKTLDVNHQPFELPQLSTEEQKKHDKGFEDFKRGQIMELLTNYGQIDLLWFDGSAYNSISFEEIREVQPGIVLNPRAWGYGDFLTFEGNLPEERVDGWWEHETCFCNGGWGYIDNEVHQPTGWLLEKLGKCRSWDGNFLPSTGPDADGVMPEVYYKRMKQMAGWMEENDKSIFGVSGGPYPEKVNVPVTCGDNAWYLHVHWLHDVPVEINDAREPKSLKLLRNGDDISYKHDDDVISFTVPDIMRTNLDDVVELKW